MNTLSFPVNNSGLLKLSQEAPGGPVILSGNNGQAIIPAGEMVQLCNLYRYVKRYDLSDNFINPRGRWIGSGGTFSVSPAAAPPAGPEETPRPLWFYLWQDGNGGIHLFRRPLMPGEDPTAVQLEIIDEHEKPLGGALLAAWPAAQMVELADLADIHLDAPAPGPDPAPDSP